MTRAIGALLLVTFIWGWTFSWMKAALDAGEAALGPGATTATIGLLVCVRFALSALLLPVALPRARKLGNQKVWTGGLVLGLLLLGGFVLQLFGLASVSPAVSAFLTSLYVLFTALLTFRRGFGPAAALGCLLATAGAGFISGPPQLTFDLPEWLTVACALLFALHILAIDTITRRVDPLAVSTTQFAWVAVGSLPVIAAGVSGPGAPTLGQLLGLLGDRAFLEPTLLCAVVGTLVAITLLNVFQRHVSPIRAAILFALEPVWASLIAIVLGTTILDGWLVFGGTMLLAGNLVVEILPRISRQRAKIA